MKAKYHVTTGPIGRAAADELAGFLRKYEIQVSGLQVQHELDDGRLVADHALAQAVAGGTAPVAGGILGGTVGGGAAVGLGCGPLLAALLAPLAPFLLPAAGVTLVANGALQRHAARRLGHPRAVAGHLRFGLANVSAERLKWTEYLLCLYAGRHGWRVAGLRHPEQASAAARARGYPRPWGERRAR